MLNSGREKIGQVAVTWGSLEGPLSISQFGRAAEEDLKVILIFCCSGVKGSKS